MNKKHNVTQLKHKTRLLGYGLSLILVWMNPACKPGEDPGKAQAFAPITEVEVAEARDAWGQGIVQIGRTYLAGGDYRASAQVHIQEFYGYELGSVLFKPTLAAEQPFRTDTRGALSYFVGGDTAYPEDHGFAIKPWKDVRWNNVGTKIIGNMAVCMGQYYFTDLEGTEVKVEYTFAYTRDEQGRLKIILHGSHLPYHPTH